MTVKAPLILRNYISLARTEAGIFRQNRANIMTVDAAAPWVTRSSTAILLIMQDECHCLPCERLSTTWAITILRNIVYVVVFPKINSAHTGFSIVCAWVDSRMGADSRINIPVRVILTRSSKSDTILSGHKEAIKLKLLVAIIHPPTSVVAVFIIYHILNTAKLQQKHTVGNGQC